MVLIVKVGADLITTCALKIFLIVIKVWSTTFSSLFRVDSNRLETLVLSPNFVQIWQKFCSRIELICTHTQKGRPSAAVCEGYIKTVMRAIFEARYISRR